MCKVKWLNYNNVNLEKKWVFMKHLIKMTMFTI